MRNLSPPPTRIEEFTQDWKGWLNNAYEQIKQIKLAPTFDGDVTLGGDVIVSSGQGIDFSATSDATGVTSELLDDYEEGTFAVTLTASTGTITIATANDTLVYTKVGRVVHCQGTINVTSVSSPTGTLTMVGLPFAGGTLTELADRTGFSVRHANLASGVTLGMWGQVNDSSSSVIINDTTTTDTTAAASYLGANTFLYFNFSYVAA